MVHDTNDGKDYVLDEDEIDAYLSRAQINITEEQIQDRSKGDILSKGLVVLQTSWFIIQLLARAVTRLPITELEFSTLAFAILNGATYALWWNKPLDVQCPIILTHHTPAADVKAVEADDGMRAHPIEQPKKRRRAMSVPFLDAGVCDKGTRASGYVLVGIALLFGGIHSVAWFSHFPITSEKLLWEVAAITTVISPLMLAVATSMHTRDNLLANMNMANFVVVVLSLIMYIIARLLLLVLAFTSLRSLPLDAYTTVQWTTFVPHI